MREHISYKMHSKIAYKKNDFMLGIISKWKIKEAKGESMTSKTKQQLTVSKFPNKISFHMNLPQHICSSKIIIIKLTQKYLKQVQSPKIHFIKNQKGTTDMQKSFNLKNIT